MGSTFIGNSLRLTVFGQSHAPAIGMTLDGLPAGFSIDLDALSAFLQRRAPGRNAHSTARREADAPEFLGGLVGSTTCGAPLAAIIRNGDQHAKDYENLKTVPRPSHADFAAQMKYGGHQDIAGGGHFSGRLTAPLCIAGGVCMQMLAHFGIGITAHIAAIAGAEDAPFDPLSPALPASADPTFPVLDARAGEEMRARIARAKADCDSVGGVIECAVTGVPAGIGEPMFDGLENRIAQLVFGIPAVKGIEFGAGFSAAAMRGSEHNDPFTVENGAVKTAANRHGGILGGISSGMPILFRAAIKPTPSIAKAQQSVDLSHLTPAKLEIHGRHDPCIVPRAVPCIEAAAAIAVLDALLGAQKDKLFWEAEE